MAGSVAGSIRGPATTIIRSPGTSRFACREAGDHASQQVVADARAADGDDAHPLVRAVAELGSQRAAVAELRRVEAGDVAGEAEVLLGPLADRRQPRPERVGDDVVGVADEDRPVAHARDSGRSARSSRRCSRRSGAPRARRRRASAASRRSRSATRRRPTSAPGSRAGSSRAPTPRRRSTGRTARSRTTSWKTMKFASRISSIRRSAWKQCRSCPADSDCDVRGLARQLRARRVDALAARLEHGCHRMLGQPVDLEVRVQPAQLVGDRDIAPGVAKSDRRGDVQRPPAAVRRAAPAARSAAGGHEEVAQQQVDLDRIAAGRHVAGAVQRDQLRRRSPRPAPRPARAADQVVGRRGSPGSGS